VRRRGTQKREDEEKDKKREQKRSEKTKVNKNEMMIVGQPSEKVWFIYESSLPEPRPSPKERKKEGSSAGFF